jgi:hypothetical protein
VARTRSARVIPPWHVRRPSGIVDVVTGHLGCESAAVMPVMERFLSSEHVNIQRAVDTYLAAHRSEWSWVPGIRPVHQRGW